MSISNATVNVALLGAYGYSLYNLHQEKSERTNFPLNAVVAPTENTIGNELPLEKEMENELKPLIGNKQLIIRDAKHSELTLENATIHLPNAKEIVVNPDLQKR